MRLPFKVKGTVTKPKDGALVAYKLGQIMTLAANGNTKRVYFWVGPTLLKECGIPTDQWVDRIKEPPDLVAKVLGDLERNKSFVALVMQNSYQVLGSDRQRVRRLCFYAIKNNTIEKVAALFDGKPKLNKLALLLRSKEAARTCKVWHNPDIPRSRSETFDCNYLTAFFRDNP